MFKQSDLRQSEGLYHENVALIRTQVSCYFSCPWNSVINQDFLITKRLSTVISQKVLCLNVILTSTRSRRSKAKEIFNKWAPDG